MCFTSKALAQTSLSRPGGPQVTPNNLEPDPEFRQNISPAQEKRNQEGSNLSINANQFRAPMNEREMKEADILKQNRANHPLGRNMNEAEAIREIWRRRTPRDLNGRDYE